MVAYYERRAVSPSLALIEQLAEALEVLPADLLGVETEAARRRGKPGPTPQLQSFSGHDSGKSLGGG